MTGSTQVVATATVREWARAHVASLDEHGWNSPPAAVAEAAMGVVDAVERAHGRGRAPLGLGPDTVVIAGTGEVRLTAPADYATAEDRAADLADLGALLFYLVTGIDPDVVGVGTRAPYERVDRLVGQLTAGNPYATGLAPIIVALLHPDPRMRPRASTVRMLLDGQVPRTGAAPRLCGALR